MESALAFPNLLYSWISCWSARANFFRPSAARQARAFSLRRDAFLPRWPWHNGECSSNRRNSVFYKWPLLLVSILVPIEQRARGRKITRSLYLIFRFYFCTWNCPSKFVLASAFFFFLLGNPTGLSWPNSKDSEIFLQILPESVQRRSWSNRWWKRVPKKSASEKWRNGARVSCCTGDVEWKG